MSERTRTLLGRALDAETRDSEDTTTPDDPGDVVADAPGVSARRNHIGGEDVDLADPRTSITFEDENNLLSGEHGRPRPREFWTAKQLGQTPPMELIKITVTQQLTGGRPNVVGDDDELPEGVADLASLIEDVYMGPHFQELTFDNLITSAVSDLIDTAWAYWETLESADGSFPVAGFKPLPPLQIQHHIDDETGALLEDPAFYQVPYKRRSGTIQMGDDSTALEREKVVVMRDPQSTRSNKLYGESIATKVREWLELIVDVDVHQKRHYSDSQLPSGFLHFQGSISDDDLQSIEQDISEAAGDPHELVTTTSEDGATWIPVGESVVDLEAIQEQQWYFKLVLAAAGLNANELGIIEGSGFAKETPALQRAIYKKVTKPMMNAILQPQNHQVVPRMVDAFDVSVEQSLRLELERFDPVHEQIERDQRFEEYERGARSLNELRGPTGLEETELMVEVGGEMVNLADVPKAMLDVLKPEVPSITVDGMDDESASLTRGPPDFESDPVLDEAEAFEELGVKHDPGATRQLEDTIDVASSFIESVAYSRATQFLQLEFERDGTNAIYWYGNCEEYRFQNILKANSKGKYFNRYVRGEYPYARVQ